MNKKIRILSLVCLVLTVLALCLPFVSCADHGVYAKIVIGETDATEVKVDLTKVDGWNEEKKSVSLENVLAYLKKENKLEYTAESGDYGAYLTAIGSLKQDAANGVYLMFWTSVTAEQDTSDFGSKKTYQSQELISASVGMSTATVCENAVILFATVQY